LKVPATANADLQHSINTSIIFNYLRDHGASNRAKIAQGLGLSTPTVSRAIETLLRSEHVVEVEKVQLENGKWPVRFSINAEHGFFVGIDLIRDPIQVAISDFSGEIKHIRSGSSIMNSADPLGEIVSSITACIGEFESLSGRKNLTVLALGVGVPAVVDPTTGTIVAGSLYENLDGLNLRDSLTSRFGVPVFTENIANLAAIGEWRGGAGRNTRNLVFFEVSNGVGAGIIVDGNLFRGSKGAAGEIGYFMSSPEQSEAGKANTGYLERIVAMSHMKTAFTEDEIQRAVRYLAMALTNIMLILDPEIVVIGGEMGDLPEANRLFIEPLTALVRENYPFVPPRIVPSSLGRKASLNGALGFALDSLLVDKYPYRL
jgi:N-acetylglucosamine repressor